MSPAGPASCRRRESRWRSGRFGEATTHLTLLDKPGGRTTLGTVPKGESVLSHAPERSVGSRRVQRSQMVTGWTLASNIRSKRE
jgi:hypothetical protein